MELNETLKWVMIMLMQYLNQESRLFRFIWACYKGFSFNFGYIVDLIVIILIVGVVWPLISKTCPINYLCSTCSAFLSWLNNVSIKLHFMFVCFMCCIHVLLWYARQICICVIKYRLIQILIECLRSHPLK